jgi:hypothetical protein
MSNATDPFIHPSRDYHSSESFWTSFLALSLVTQSRVSSPLRIPAFQCVMEGKHGCFEPDEHLVVSRPLQRSEVVVEGKVRPGFLPRVPAVPNELLDLRPDLVITADDSIIIIEVKTVGHDLGRYQKKCYDNLETFLAGHNYTVAMYCLLSAGHEKDRDFEILKKDPESPSRFRLLLWEKVVEYLDTQAPRLPLVDALGDICEYYRAGDGYMRW